MDIPNLQPRFDQQNGGLVEFGDDNRLLTTFSVKPQLNSKKSQEAGRPIYDQVEFVRIQQPAERDCYEQPATELHKRRFGRQYHAFLEGKADIPSGTLLSMLFPNNPEIVENLKVVKIVTVEQLANLNDTQIQNIGLGGREFHERAKKYLSVAEKGAGFHELEKELKEVGLKVLELTERNRALEEAISANKSTKRGRPRKNTEEA